MMRTREVADERSAEREVGLGLELATVRRGRPPTGGRPAEGGGVPRRDREGVRWRALVRPGAAVPGYRAAAEGAGRRRRRLGVPVRARPGGRGAESDRDGAGWR